MCHRKEHGLVIDIDWNARDATSPNFMILFDDDGESVVIIDVHVWPVAKCPTSGVIPGYGVFPDEKHHDWL